MKSFLIFQVLGIKYVLGSNRLPLWGRIVHLKLAGKSKFDEISLQNNFFCISKLQYYISLTVREVALNANLRMM